MFREKGAQTATANRVIDVIEIEQSRPNAQWTKHLNAETHKIFIHFAQCARQFCTIFHNVRIKTK